MKLCVLWHRYQFLRPIGYTRDLFNRMCWGEYMKFPTDSSIAIVGAARDVADVLPKLIEVFHTSFKGFKEVSYFIVENNSIDTTKKVLTQLQSEKPKFYAYSLPENLNKIKYKTERIAIARNFALNEVKKITPGVDYVAVADLDAINLGLTREAIESCWQHKDWSALFANQPDGYYDIYALRHKIWNPRDFLLDYEFLKDQFNDKIALELSLKSRRIKIDKAFKLVEVDSAFGGLGIYKAQDLFKEVYIGLDGSGNPICEHLSINLGIIGKGGSLFINPALTNTLNYTWLTKIKAIVYEKYIRKNTPMGID